MTTHDVNPITYKLSLEPDLTQFTFSGTLEILAETQKPVQQLLLNILDLAIWSCHILVDENFVACPFSVDPQGETLKISLPQKISGNIILKIEYQGKIGDKMAGFYRSHFKTEGTSTPIAVTQFEESDARRAFPCFDHPSQKAVFEIELVIDERLSAISNGPIRSEEKLDDGKKRVRFQPTPRMSTYLVFFGVGEFEFIEDKEKVMIRVATMPSMIKHAQFGLDFGRKSLKFCEDLFGIPYPLEKLDLIAIPDFAFGAMENWGAITFRENLLLRYDGITSKAGEENICNVVAHEIVHQWFGNLVTPSDWKYLWLNESFATYLAHVIVSHYHPKWQVLDHFLQSQTAPALERDALQETIPIEIPGGEHVVINTSTAPIIYNKGGSILEQIEGYLGEEAFSKGLRRYLKDHEYDCASSHHFWKAFEAVTEKPITKIMKSWIEQPGFPILEVQRKDSKLIIRQKRFTFLPNDSNQTWVVPVAIQSYHADGGSKIMNQLLDTEKASVDLGKNTVAYKINAGRKGFYRVRYMDRNNLEWLGKHIQDKRMGSRDSWGLQNDLYALVKSTEISLDDYLDFLSYYKNEDSFLPLMSIMDNLHHGYQVTEGRAREKIAATGKTLLENVLNKIGLEPSTTEEHTTSVLRDHMLWQATLFGSHEVNAFGLANFDRLMNEGSVHPDISRSVMQIGALNGIAGAFDWFDQKFQSSDSEHERMNILMAIGSFRDTLHIEKAQLYVLNRIPERNKTIPISSMAANPYAMSSLWQWYISNLSRLEPLHPLLYERIIAAIVPMAGLGRENQVIEFFKDYLKHNPMPRDVIKLSLEKLKINSRMKSATLSPPLGLNCRLL